MPAFKVIVFFLVLLAMCNARRSEFTDEDSAGSELHQRGDALDETRKQQNSVEEETLNTEADDIQHLPESHSNKRKDDFPGMLERSTEYQNQAQKIGNDLPFGPEQEDESEDHYQDESPSVLSARNKAERREIIYGPGIWDRGLDNRPPGLWGRGLSNKPPGLWGRGLENRPPGLWGRGLQNRPPGLWGREVRGSSALGLRNANKPPGLWGRGLRSRPLGLWGRELNNKPPGLWGRGLQNRPPGLWGREIEKVSKASKRELIGVKSTEEDGNESKEDIQELK